jgi:hypothetical protein
MEVAELTRSPIRRRLSAFSRRILPERNFRFVQMVFQLTRFWWWCFSSYFPRLVASRFVRRAPEVRSFGAPLASSDLVNKLQSVNLLAPTKMCRLMTKRGSDKARPNNYTVFGALQRSLPEARADF